MSDHVWAIVALVSGALFTGDAFFVAIERVPIWRRLDDRSFAIDFRRSIRRADPTQPILLIVCAGSAVGFATATGGASRTLALLAAGLLGLILVASVGLGEPINSQFRRRPEGEVPVDVQGLRRRWSRMHLVRAATAIGAFACLAAAVAYA
jgi:Domain of unknown function (DUF1772)